MIAIEELREAARKAFPPDAAPLGRDEGWSRIAGLGWLMAGLSEDQGGLGLGRDGAVAIPYELGRSLARPPLVPAMLGLAGIAGSANLPDRDDWIARICEGAYVPLNMLPASVRIAQDGSLSGTVAGMFDAGMARHVLLGLPELYVLVPLDAVGVSVIERPLWDETRHMSDVALYGHVPDAALVVARGPEATALHDLITPLAQLAIAADSLGGATQVLEITVDYLKTRKQFDRPLAMFQALKHRCADLKTRIATADALFWQRAADPHASLADIGALKALATDVYAATVEEAIQLHGGIGLTDEHAVHRFMKRAMLNRVLCGSEDHWLEQVGRQELARA